MSNTAWVQKPITENNRINDYLERRRELLDNGCTYCDNSPATMIAVNWSTGNPEPLCDRCSTVWVGGKKMKRIEYF